MIALTFISKGLPQLLLSPFIGGIVDCFSKKDSNFHRCFTGWLLEILSPQVIGSPLAICCIFVSFIWIFLFYRGELSEESTIT